jgi:hypothetical protein
VKTDRREAMPWARLLHSGALPPVEVPTVEDAAIRALCRARAEALQDLKAAPLRLNAFVLRHASRATGHATWNPAQLRWLSAVVCPPPAQHMVLQA